MPASYKIVGTFQEGGIGRLGFTADGIKPQTRITADYQNGAIRFPLAVHSTYVGLPLSYDKPIYVVDYPLAGEHDERLVRLFADEVRLAPAPSLSKSSYAHRVIRHFTHEVQPSIIPDLASQHVDEHPTVELLGLYPLDKDEMVMRARITISSELAQDDWHCLLTTFSSTAVTVKASALDDTRLETGCRQIIVSCKMPRKLAPALLTVTSSHPGALPGFYGLSRQLQKARLIEFYRMTTDAKSDTDYPAWFAQHRTALHRLEDQRMTHFDNAPLISIIIPVFEPPLDFFDACVQSVLAQTYNNWELVLVNASPEDAEARVYLDALDD